jgi:hypothetical protein
MRRLLTLLLPMLLLAAAQAPAGRALADQIALDFQHARIVKLAKPAKSVIVGDPYVVDITMEDPTTLVLFGKEPGITNLVVLDQNSDILLNWPVMVRDATENRVSVISPGAAGDKRNIYEGVWLCTDQNRCLRIPGASDIEPFKYNATQASTNPATGSGGGSNNNNNNNNSNNGGGDQNGGNSGGETPPPSN